MHRFLALLLPILLFTAGCAGVRVTDYAERQPVLKPEVFFNGPMTAHGVVKDRKGRVIRHFNAEIVGRWEGNTGVLEEDFIFDNGELQRRVWTFVLGKDGRLTGTAGDVVGEAKGRISGNAFFLKYVLRVPYRGRDIDLTIDDRLYLTDENTLIAESIMKKFGFRVGEILLVMRKTSQQGPEFTKNQ
jgi:hypothetical protein